MIEKLFSMQDSDYKAFHSKLMPTVDPDVIIGVRTPELRKFAKQIDGTPDAEAFLKNLPHQYYEENNLHGFLLEKRKDYEKCMEEIERFLPYVDNWATCDLMRPKVFKKHLPELLVKITEWIHSEHTYTIRFGIEMLMCYYLDEHFKPEYLQMVSLVKHEDYYVKMMVAWYFATALAKQYEEAVVYLENRCLEPWTHNKTIQKSVESYRITDEQKRYLKTLKLDMKKCM